MNSAQNTNLEHTKTAFKKTGIHFDDGLSSAEINHLEKHYGFAFPPDLKEVLSFAPPVNKWFIDWRTKADTAIQQKLIWPLEGICFDIEHNNFWLEDWGNKPATS